MRRSCAIYFLIELRRIKLGLVVLADVVERRNDRVIEFVVGSEPASVNDQEFGISRVTAAERSLNSED